MGKELIVIAGPTASGKTGLAVQLAHKVKTEILSADSRQCFAEMNIGVAKPTIEEMQGVPHYFIGSHSILDTVNAGSFEKYSLDILERIFAQHDKAIAVGGTGLYLKALCEGLDNIPAATQELRENIITQYQQKGLIWLQNELQSKDAMYWKETQEKENPQRLMRALEVAETTGNSILSYRNQTPIKRYFSIKKYAIEWKRADLYERINQRVDQMMEAGLLEEVKSLYTFKNLNALQTVGYTELWDYLDGKYSLEAAIEKIKINTRHYAKRQMTWFKKDLQYQWIPAEQLDTFLLQF